MSEGAWLGHNREFPGSRGSCRVSTASRLAFYARRPCSAALPSRCCSLSSPVSPLHVLVFCLWGALPLPTLRLSSPSPPGQPTPQPTSGSTQGPVHRPCPHPSLFFLCRQAPHPCLLSSLASPARELCHVLRGGRLWLAVYHGRRDQPACALRAALQERQDVSLGGWGCLALFTMFTSLLRVSGARTVCVKK